MSIGVAVGQTVARSCSRGGRALDRRAPAPRCASLRQPAACRGSSVTAAAPSASGVLVPDASAAAMFDAALAAGGATPLTLRTRSWARPLPLSRWCGSADEADAAVLDRYVADLPGDARVLDLGCGPGRHTEHLTFAGLKILGVDTSPTAIALTRRRGALAVCADALGPLPGGSHGWDGVVLLDGNGIGGDPLRLLCRVGDLLGPQGSVLVELDGSGCSDRCPSGPRRRRQDEQALPVVAPQSRPRTRCGPVRRRFASDRLLDDSRRRLRHPASGPPGVSRPRAGRCRTDAAWQMALDRDGARTPTSARRLAPRPGQDRCADQGPACAPGLRSARSASTRATSAPALSVQVGPA
jgi:SAM-dependent methyltransferase